MSLLPIVFRDWWDDYSFPLSSCLMDQNFGSGIHRDHLLNSVWGNNRNMAAGYRRPWQLAVKNLLKPDAGSTVNIDKEKFEVVLDVQHFAPNEVQVKVIDDYVVVEGKHEEKQDEHGHISRQFSRRYRLPPGINPETIQSQLSSDGVLKVIAPMTAAVTSNVVNIPVTETGLPAKNKEPEKITNNS